MRVFLLSLLLVGLAYGQKPYEKGVCPPRRGSGIGLCVFNPDINCTGDEQCETGKLCCPDGCNRSCMEAVPAPKVNHDEVCPPTGEPTFGACVFDPKVNCAEDNECQNGQVCCPQGCNRICKDPVYRPKPPITPPVLPPTPPTPTKEDTYSPSCPANKGGFIVGACVFDASKNCLNDSECKNGKICCPSGCNRECMNPEPMEVHPGSKP